MIIWKDWRLATIHIYYYRPDYVNFIQEFIWQTEDIVPNYPRTHKFLWHWKNNIKVPIQSIEITHCDFFGKKEYINCKQILDL